MTASLPRAFGPYLLLARLGKGGAGSAYLARHRDEVHGAPVDARPLVVKILHPRLTERPEFIKRFRHEADVAVRVSSPHVVRVLDAGRVGEQPYIAMDYIRGWTLSRLNSRMAETDVRMALSLALELTLQSLQGLVALHEATDRAGRPLETVHRDLAPKNIMVGDDGRVRLIDLGLGKSRAQDWKTGTGTVMGSPGYMAPEQVTGDPVDQRTDLYAVGVVLHELLTGQRYVKPGLRSTCCGPRCPEGMRRRRAFDGRSPTRSTRSCPEPWLAPSAIGSRPRERSSTPCRLSCPVGPAPRAWSDWSRSSCSRMGRPETWSFSDCSASPRPTGKNRSSGPRSTFSTRRPRSSRPRRRCKPGSRTPKAGRRP